MLQDLIFTKELQHLSNTEEDSRNKRAKQESGCPMVGMKGRVPFEAGDALLALPIASTAGTFLLPPFWQFAVEQIEVEVKDSNPMLRSHCGCQIPARETWPCAGVTAG